MCIGIPMQVLEANEQIARCVAGDDSACEAPHDVDVTLIDPVQAGDWVLVFLGAARRALEETEALLIRDALRAMTSAASEGTIESGCFPDLEQGEPRLPPHLEAARKAGAATG